MNQYDAAINQALDNYKQLEQDAARYRHLRSEAGKGVFYITDAKGIRLFGENVNKVVDEDIAK